MMIHVSGTTIISAPERGPWGDPRYRGNCSGYVHAELLARTGARKMAELFAGGGTGYDVCRELGVEYVGADLNPDPARPGILVVDAVSDDVPDSFCDAGLVFMHPPYGKEIGIPYAGSMYPDPSGELSKEDLGQMPWPRFMAALNAVVMKYYAAMAKGAHMGILMGDVRRSGRFYSMLADIVKPGELEQIYVKLQYNTASEGRGYSGGGFARIVHEFVMLLKKPGDYIIAYRLPQEHAVDMRDSASATWRDVIKASLEHLGGEAPLEAIYREIDGHEKAKNNPHWREKIRQTLQISNLFTSSERGVWTLAA